MSGSKDQILVQTLEHLKKLVAFDTQNPPRDISSEGGIIEYLKNNLPGFEFTLYDAGDGCMALLAERGKTERLYNFHIDTVPVAPGWERDPFALSIEGDKAYGLGSCDIKGASASMLTAASLTEGPLALLFSTDEEHGSSLAVKNFLNQNSNYSEVIVSEPTMAAARVAHRGIQSAKVNFTGRSGHASEARAIEDNAIHKQSQWLNKVLQSLKASTASYKTLKGVPFNVGKIEGGIKNNMIAASCELTFGFRPLPGMDSKLMLDDMKADAAALGYTNDFTLEPMFFGPTLPAANQDFNEALNAAEQLADKCAIPIGEPVNFWTEASLFSEAGMTALVYGPGNIEQAHTADEWVALEQLEKITNHYIAMINSTN